MSGIPRLVLPGAVRDAVVAVIEATWCARVVSAVAGEARPLGDFPLRPHVRGEAAVDRVGRPAFRAWRDAWREVGAGDLDGVELRSSPVAIGGTSSEFPEFVHIASLEAGLAFVKLFPGDVPAPDIVGATVLARRLRDAGAAVRVGTLRQVLGLSHDDAEAVVSVVSWLGDHEDLSGWTISQLPIPSVHTKWLGRHGGLVRELTGRDVVVESRSRPPVVHLTYVDPGYLAAGGRRHDAWTAGDRHELAYRPRIVLVVENRDCRLWFPQVAGAVVVEGGGSAAAAVLGGIEWLVGADSLVYWGDIDADGFAILHELRQAMQEVGVTVTSILMDAVAHARFADMGVNADRRGEPLRARSRRLPSLTPGEQAAYASVASTARVPFRRIEQERIPLDAAVDALLDATTRETRRDAQLG